MKRLQDHIGTALFDKGYIDKDIVDKTVPVLSAQEVTGGVTNYVARLPEPANTMEEWKASLVSSTLANDKFSKTKLLN